jgi:hypothetical protein
MLLSFGDVHESIHMLSLIYTCYIRKLSLITVSIALVLLLFTYLGLLFAKNGVMYTRGKSSGQQILFLKGSTTWV